jgi:hypothetical protein
MFFNSWLCRPGVSETIYDEGCSLITNQSCRLDRWAEHFEEQFIWPEPVHVADVSEMVRNCNPNSSPSETEVINAYRL